MADNNNHRVQAFDFATLAFQRTWGQFGTEVGDFGYTRALAAVADDPAGGVAVADTANNRVQTFAPDGAPTAAWGIAGRGPGYVTRPEGVAIDAAGTVHVADTLDHRVERLSADGAYLGQTGYISANSGYASPGGRQRAVQHPGRHRRRPRRPGASGSPTPPTPASRRSGSTAPGRRPPPASTRRARSRSRPTARSTSPTPATAASSAAIPAAARGRRFTAGLASPAGVAATSAAVYVADTGANRILRVAGATTSTLPAPPGGLSAPTGLAAAAGAVYVADTGANRVLRFNEGAGTWDVLGTDGTGAGQFIAPHGLALDAGATHARRGRHGQRPPAAHHPERDAAAGARASHRRHGGHRDGHGVQRPGRRLVPDRLPAGLQPRRRRAPGGPGGERLDLRRLVGRVRGSGPCDVSMGADRGVTAAFVATGAARAAAPGRPRPHQPARAHRRRQRDARDRTAPRLRGVSLRPRRLRAARRGATIAAVASGAALRYALSERGVLTIAIERADRARALPGVARAAAAHRRPRERIA